MFAYLIQDPEKKINFIENPAPKPVNDFWGQLTERASTFDHVDGLFYFTYAVCIFFFVLILGVLLFSVVKYRRKTWDQPAASNTTHNTPLEVVWTVIPLIIVMVMFAWGFKGCMDMTTVPLEASRNTYKASASQWQWVFTYPDMSTSSGEVWMEVGKPAQFLLESSDVLHAFYMPAMRVKRDVIPGRFQSIWFTPIRQGDFHLFCAEYCGQDHSRMYARVHVVDAAAFAKKPWDVIDDETPEKAVKYGKSLYKARCATCHSIDGSRGTGPSWAGATGLFVKSGDKVVGREHVVIDSKDKQRKTVTVDDAYIRRSIATPNAEIVADFPNGGMSDFPDLDPARASGADGPKNATRRVNCLIAFMQSLAQ